MPVDYAAARELLDESFREAEAQLLQGSPPPSLAVVSTFNSKIGPTGISDYLFMITPAGAAPDARMQSYQYFAQGHEINFVEIKPWVVMILATIGKSGRLVFNQKLLELLDQTDVPKALKVAWNDHVAEIIAGQTS